MSGEFKEKVIIPENHRHFVLVTYDISKNRLRNKVNRIMKSYGFRVQRSVFESFLTASQIEDLKKKVKNFLDPTDNIKLYSLSIYSKTWEYGCSKFDAGADINTSVMVC